MKNHFLLEEYPFYVRPLSQKDGGGYVIEFPDLPGCISDGETPEDAIRNGRDTLKCMLLTLKELGRPIPKPGVSSSASGQWRQRSQESACPTRRPSTGRRR